MICYTAAGGSVLGHSPPVGRCVGTRAVGAISSTTTRGPPPGSDLPQRDSSTSKTGHRCAARSSSRGKTGSSISRGLQLQPLQLLQPPLQVQLPLPLQVQLLHPHRRSSQSCTATWTTPASSTSSDRSPTGGSDASGQTVRQFKYLN
jgi:hypothetical protein